ncbi:MAG: hypothetical protein QXJ93_02130 [Candidatus Rehaiarchaeum fermentans]|nr:hypothetical protein [Candidatus Rehaiarchaeum fermentans]
MNFRTVLMLLDRMEKLYGGEGVSSRIFAHYSKLSIRNANRYLLRLYKMNLASRKKANNYNTNLKFKTNKPYLYKVNKQGHNYLIQLEKQKSNKIKYLKLEANLFHMNKHELLKLKHDLNKHQIFDKSSQTKLISLINKILKKKLYNYVPYILSNHISK